jgi:hypothetical protein
MALKTGPGACDTLQELDDWKLVFTVNTTGLARLDCSVAVFHARASDQNVPRWYRNSSGAP